MPRLPRFNLPGIAYHVVQRGNNRRAVFLGDTDYQAYLQWLEKGRRAYGVIQGSDPLKTDIAEIKRSAPLILDRTVCV